MIVQFISQASDKRKVYADNNRNFYFGSISKENADRRQ